MRKSYSAVRIVFSIACRECVAEIVVAKSRAQQRLHKSVTKQKHFQSQKPIAAQSNDASANYINGSQNKNIPTLISAEIVIHLAVNRDR